MLDPLARFAAPVLAALSAGGVALLLGYWWVERRERERLLRRLGGVAIQAVGPVASATEIIRHDSGDASRWWRLAQRAPGLQDAGQLLEQAGLEWTVARLARLTAGAALAGTVLGAALAGFFPGGLVGFVAGLSAPSLYVRHRRAKRVRIIEEQLPEAIDLLTRAIRAGHALTTALRLVAEETAEPLASEFRRVFEEQKYGMRFEDSLLSLTRRVDLIDVRVMVVAVLVQREVGGNLAEILDKIAHLIRTRFSLRRQVRVYTAQGRMSGYVLGLLPVGLAGVIFLVNPPYIMLLFSDPAGRVLLGTAVTLQLAGYFWISRILDLDL